MKSHFKTISYLYLILFGLLFMVSCSEDDPINTEPPISEPPITELLPPIVLACDYFSEDRVLENDTLRPVDYIIDCWANVKGSLKIEPGVVIEFENDAGLDINLENNVLEIKGTEEEPVILTGTSKQKGYWKGIFFREAYNLNNLIEHTIIAYAGSQNFTQYSPVYEGSLAIRGVSGTTPQALTLNHVEISNGGSVGLDFHAIEKNATVSTSNLVITGNEGVPVKVSAEMAHVFDNTSSYAGNVVDFFNITTSYYEIEDQTVSWQKLDVPYLVEGRVHIKHNGHLTIEAGVEMQFKPEGYLQPYDGSTEAGNELSLKIHGTEEDPVYLKAYNGISWGGLLFGFSQEPNIISYAIIENATGDFPVGNHENTGAIYLHAQPVLTVENTVFRNLPNCAFYGYGTDPFKNVTVSNLLYDGVGMEYCTE